MYSIAVPELSRFFGIVIRMFMEVGAPHHRPHFHALYQDPWLRSLWIRSNALAAGSLGRSNALSRLGRKSIMRNYYETGNLAIGATSVQD